MARASSPPEATFASGSGRLARVGAEEELHLRPRRVVADTHLETGAFEGELLQVGLDGGGELGCGFPARSA